MARTLLNEEGRGWEVGEDSFWKRGGVAVENDYYTKEWTNYSKEKCTTHSNKQLDELHEQQFGGADKQDILFSSISKIPDLEYLDFLPGIFS